MRCMPVGLRTRPDESRENCMPLPVVPSRGCSKQDAEEARQRRSRIAQGLNVPKRTPRRFARCGLAERTF
jgi:hypothetical protein